MNNLENQSQIDVNQQIPRRKNALTCEESSKMEREIKKNDQGNVNNQPIITGFSQLNLNDKIVKK